jgi:cytidylate kinase
MRIITISRQFGSGGRELGKRLAEKLGWDYYDKEIIETLAEKNDLDGQAVREILSRHGWHHIQLTYRHSFSQIMVNPALHTRMLLHESEIIREIAEAGNDCVIVGRDADVILQDYDPFRMLVCSDEEARLARCMKHEQKQPENERLSEKQILRNIRRIDRGRARTREVLTGKRQGDASAFELTVNTGGWEIKRLCTALADYALRWFGED